MTQGIVQDLGLHSQDQLGQGCERLELGPQNSLLSMLAVLYGGIGPCFLIVLGPSRFPNLQVEAE